MAFSVMDTTTNKIENYTTSRDVTPSADRRDLVPIQRDASFVEAKPVPPPGVSVGAAEGAVLVGPRLKRSLELGDRVYLVGVVRWREQRWLVETVKHVEQVHHSPNPPG